jgi:hypothetical protein
MILAARLKTQDSRLKTSRSESDKLAILTKILWLQYVRNRDRVETVLFIKIYIYFSVCKASVCSWEWFVRQSALRRKVDLIVQFFIWGAVFLCCI